MANEVKVNENVMLLEVRLRNAYLDKPFVGKNDKGDVTQTYSARGLFAPGSKAHTDLSATIQRVAAGKWGAQAGAYIQEMAAADRLCLHDGATKASDPEFVGKKFFSATSRRKPKALVTRVGANVEIGADDPCYPYAGCWANVLVNVWPQDPKGQWPRRINAEVIAVQFLRHDEAFAGGGTQAVDLTEFPQVETAGADAAPPAAAGAGGGLL
jgi:hypothetical protein